MAPKYSYSLAEIHADNQQSSSNNEIKLAKLNWLFLRIIAVRNVQILRLQMPSSM